MRQALEIRTGQQNDSAVDEGLAHISASAVQEQLYGHPNYFTQPYAVAKRIANPHPAGTFLPR